MLAQTFIHAHQSIVTSEPPRLAILINGISYTTADSLVTFTLMTLITYMMLQSWHGNCQNSLFWHLTTELGTLAKFSGLASFELLQDDAFDI